MVAKPLRIPINVRSLTFLLPGSRRCRRQRLNLLIFLRRRTLSGVSLLLSPNCSRFINLGEQFVLMVVQSLFAKLLHDSMHLTLFNYWRRHCWLLKSNLSEDHITNWATCSTKDFFITVFYNKAEETVISILSDTQLTKPIFILLKSF